MGYQEYICRVDNIKSFCKRVDKADDYIDNKSFKEIGYALVEFKEDFNDVKKGIYIYVYGDRTIGSRFLGFLKNNVIGESSYVATIEEAIKATPFLLETNEYGEKLDKLFNEKSTKFGRVIYDKIPNKDEKERGIEAERSIYGDC